MLILYCSLIALAPAADTAVVCPREFQPAMAEWIKYRRAQGHDPAFVSSEGAAGEIRERIRRLAAGGDLKFVVLVGDAAPKEGVDERTRGRMAPTFFDEAKINVDYGSEPEIASDNGYADLDGDGRPDVAVGRLPADDRDELAVMIEKILAYERSRDLGDWRRRVNVVAGVGGFGLLIDSLIETAAKKFLTEGVPSCYDLTMTYGSWRSPYCPDPRLFHRHTLGRLNEGCLFWVYIGHGQTTYLDQVRTPGGRYHILSTSDVEKIRITRGSPIAIFLACYTGAFDLPRDCLAEEMVKHKGGPVAALAGSRVTMPYAMTVLGSGLLDECFNRRRRTIGEIVLNAKRRMVAPPAEDDPHAGTRRLLDTAASLISGGNERLAAERFEHLALFNLLGDPLLRIRHAESTEIDAPRYADAGGEIEITGDSPVSGRLVVELTCRRDRAKESMAARPEYEHSREFFESLSVDYDKANDRVWRRQAYRYDGGPFRLSLPVDAAAHGPCHVRVFVEGDGGFAVGAADVYVRKAKPEGSE